MKVLMVLTSHDQLGNTGQKTGLWLEEFAAPYYAFRDAGADLTLASPKGGQAPIDPKSDAADAQTDATRRFRKDVAAQTALATTAKLAGITADGYDAVFYPGGHGPLWDLAQDAASRRLVEAFDKDNRPIGAVCHAPGVLRGVRGRDGKPLVAGRSVTGFSNAEEAAAGLTDVVPFLVEDMLKEMGGIYSKGPDWTAHVLVDRNLVTGQNPASSVMAAQEILALLGEDTVSEIDKSQDS